MARAYLAVIRRRYYSKSVAGASNVTLTADESSNGALKFTGALTGNIDVILADATFIASGLEWICENATSGAFALRFIGPTGAGVYIAQGRSCLISSDGTNLIQRTRQLNTSGVATSDGYQSIVLTDADATLSAAQYVNRNLKFTGTLTATRNITLPNVAGAEFIVDNRGTGQSLVFKVTGQTGVTVANNKIAGIRCNGTDYERIWADT